MPTNHTVFTLNAPRMIHETIDKETVIIDTETGLYFSLLGSGYLVYQLLEVGASVASTSAQLGGLFATPPEVIEPAIEAIFAQLEAEALIIPTAAQQAGAALPDLPVAAGELFVAPLLEKFTNMAGLLLVDPIHEVKDTGWPHRA